MPKLVGSITRFAAVGRWQPSDGCVLNVRDGTVRLPARDEPVGTRGLTPRRSRGGLLVNAAYLLLTSAWMAGADPAPVPVAAPAAAAPVVSTGSCCGGGCGQASSCCDSCGRESFFDRMRGRFSKH